MITRHARITEQNEAPGLRRDERKRATDRRRLCTAPAQAVSICELAVSDIKNRPFDTKDTK